MTSTHCPRNQGKPTLTLFLFPYSLFLASATATQELLCVGHRLSCFVHMAHCILRCSESQPCSRAIRLGGNRAFRVGQSFLPMSQLCLAAAQKHQSQRRIMPDLKNFLKMRNCSDEMLLHHFHRT